MKQLWMLTTCLLLLGCSGSVHSACSWMGIDTARPNFYERHDTDALDNYYACRVAEAAPDSVNHFFLGWGVRNNDPLFVQQDLNYQWNLWKQLRSGTITPVMAEQAWLQWSAQQNFQRQQLMETRRIRDAAYDAASELRRRQ